MSSAEIYYFTGTGNSLAIAKNVAKKINAELYSITSVINKQEINLRNDVVGIIFPVYHGSLPSIVEDFISKISNIENKYVFSICTYGDSPGITMKTLSNIIKKKKGSLAAGFAVKMPYNYITPSSMGVNFYDSFILREIEVSKQQYIFKQAEKKLNNICELICAQTIDILETDMDFLNNIISKLNLKETLGKSVWLKIGGFDGKTPLPFSKSIRFMDYKFHFDDKCNSCGICEKVCPVNNIVLRDNKPAWKHQCEQCFACLQWCPQSAIQFGNKTANCKRYHHPEIKLSELIE